MVLKSLQGLKFVQKPTYTTSGGDPKMALRARFIKTLHAQIELAQKPDMDGRRWWKEANGKCIASLRYRNSPIPVGGKEGAFFEVVSRNALVQMFKAVSKEVEAGEWDQILMAKSAEIKNAAKKKASE